MNNDMKFEVTYASEFREHPYCVKDNNDKWCHHLELSRYQTEDLDTCLLFVRELLDAPEAEISLEQIKKDFSYSYFHVNGSSDQYEQKMMSIYDYYNGRLALFERIKSDIDVQSLKDQKTFRYDIPEKYNAFDLEDGDEHQIDAYIEVKILV